MTKSKELKFILVAIFLHALLAVVMGYFVNIWTDEAATLFTTRNGFVYALQNALAIEKQAPLYFWCLSLWREVNSSIFFARVFSIIFSLVAIKLFLSLAKRFWNSGFSVAVTFAFALHPFLFWASNEIRGYSLTILLSVVLLTFFCNAYWLSDENADKSYVRKQRLFYIIAAITSLYSSYFLGFVLVGCFVSLLVLRRWKSAREYFVDMLIAGIFFVPMLFVIKSQFATRTSDFVPQTHLIEGIKVLWGHFVTFALPAEIYSNAEPSAVAVFRIWILRFACVAGLILLLVKRRLFDAKLLAFGTIIATVLLFFLALYMLTGTLHIQIRHMAVIFVPILLLVFSVIRNLKPDDSKGETFYFVGISLILAIFYGYSIVNIHPNFTKRGDWQRAAQFIGQNESANQPIIVFANYDAISLPNYYKGTNKILPDDKFFDWNYEGESGTEKMYTKQIEFVISQIPKDAAEIWFLTDESCQTTEACAPLEKYLESNYNIVEQQDFYYERVRLWRKK
jgi:uncharacterized membrane protein